LFIVHDGHVKEYVTMCTPECRIAIDDYISYRKEKGEDVTPESPLYQTKGDNTTDDSRYMISSTIEHALRKAKIERKKIGDRYTISEVHGFRKFTNTQMNNAGLESNVIEKFMGHQNDLKGRYYDGRSKELFVFYKKAIPYLTILEENRQKETIEKLQNQTTDGEIALAKQVTDMQQKLDSALQKLEDAAEETLYEKQKVEGMERNIELERNNIVFENTPQKKASMTFADLAE